MTDRLLRIAVSLRTRIPDLDVRTDQCNFLRIHLQRSTIAVNDKSSAIIATWSEHSTENDFESTKIGEYASSSENEVVEEVLRWVVRESSV